MKAILTLKLNFLSNQSEIFVKADTENIMKFYLIIHTRADSAILTSDLTGIHIAPTGDT